MHVLSMALYLYGQHLFTLYQPPYSPRSFNICVLGFNQVRDSSLSPFVDASFTFMVNGRIVNQERYKMVLLAYYDRGTFFSSIKIIDRYHPSL